MEHRITCLEFHQKRGTLVVRAMGRSARGTKFHIRSVTVPAEGKSKAEAAQGRAEAIEQILNTVVSAHL